MTETPKPGIKTVRKAEIQVPAQESLTSQQKLNTTNPVRLIGTDVRVESSNALIVINEGEEAKQLRSTEGIDTFSAKEFGRFDIYPDSIVEVSVNGVIQVLDPMARPPMLAPQLTGELRVYTDVPIMYDKIDVNFRPFVSQRRFLDWKVQMLNVFDTEYSQVINNALSQVLMGVAHPVNKIWDFIIIAMDANFYTGQRFRLRGGNMIGPFTEQIRMHIPVLQKSVLVVDNRDAKVQYWEVQMLTPPVGEALRIYGLAGFGQARS